MNAKLGHARFLVFYFACGAIAGLLYFLLGHDGYMLGASGAVMGVAGIFLVLFPRNEIAWLWVQMTYVGVFHLATGWVILFYVVMDVVGALFFREAGVAYLGHLFGAAVGFAAGSWLVLSGAVKSTPYEENLFQTIGILPPAPRKVRRRKVKVAPEE